jgi:hypothetical protein
LQYGIGIKKGDKSRDLILPDINTFEVKGTYGAMKRNGEYLAEVVRLNEAKRNIKILNKIYADKLEVEFRKLMGT